ncbi:MAG: PBP1A family penicillin-binding protein [Myxococcota bacterium]
MNVWVKRLVITGAVLAVLGVLGGVGGLAGIFWYYGRDLEALDEEGLKNYRPPQVTRIYAADGTLIGELFEQRRTLVRYEDIPTHVENAFLAAEDSDFYRHEGMDYTGMVRALIANVRAGRVTQGASTITQQVVKIFMLSSERTLERKVQELILARRLEQAFTKAQILELYLNEIYLGHGRYGIEEASWFYFGKGIGEINLGQAALLATLPKAPGRDSPIQNPTKAKTRQVYVLEQMVKHGFATPEDAQPFIEGPLEVADPTQRRTPVAGAEEFVDVAVDAVREHYGEDTLRTLGASVYTSVSMQAQADARKAALTGLAAIDTRNGYGHGLKPANEDAAATLRTASAGAMTVGRRLEALIETPPADGMFSASLGGVSVDVAVPEGSRYDDPALGPEQFPAGAIVPVRITKAATDGAPARARIDAGPEAAVVVVDVESGAVLAMVGGSTYDRGDFNRATDAKRQPGSSFKPFVYGAALESKTITPASLLDDSPEVYKDWKPTNYRRDKYLGKIRARIALAKSVNTIPVKLIDELGPKAVIDFAHRMGIDAALPENLSIALGTGEVTPFEMARAYLTLARGGERIEPVFVTRVEAPGMEPWLPEVQTQKALDPDVAFVLTSMMRSVVTEGTARKAGKLGREAVGKTGTSNESKDAWFAGFTPEHVTVTWVGFDTPRRVGRGETGGKAALPIWLDAMSAVSTGPAKTFVPPASVVVRSIDASSGLLVPTGAAAADYDGKAIDEVFLAGTAPVEEAVPAALPKGDVVLGLYDEEPSEAADDGLGALPELQ